MNTNILMDIGDEKKTTVDEAVEEKKENKKIRPKDLYISKTLDPELVSIIHNTLYAEKPVDVHGLLKRFRMHMKKEDVSHNYYRSYLIPNDDATLGLHPLSDSIGYQQFLACFPQHESQTLEYIFNRTFDHSQFSLVNCTLAYIHDVSPYLNTTTSQWSAFQNILFTPSNDITFEQYNKTAFNSLHRDGFVLPSETVRDIVRGYTEVTAVDDNKMSQFILSKEQQKQYLSQLIPLCQCSHCTAMSVFRQVQAISMTAIWNHNIHHLAFVEKLEKEQALLAAKTMSEIKLSHDAETVYTRVMMSLCLKQLFKLIALPDCLQISPFFYFNLYLLLTWVGSFKINFCLKHNITNRAMYQLSIFEYTRCFTLTGCFNALEKYGGETGRSFTSNMRYYFIGSKWTLSIKHKFPCTENLWIAGNAYLLSILNNVFDPFLIKHLELHPGLMLNNSNGVTFWSSFGSKYSKRMSFGLAKDKINILCQNHIGILENTRTGLERICSHHMFVLHHKTATYSVKRLFRIAFADRVRHLEYDTYELLQSIVLSLNIGAFMVNDLGERYLYIPILNGGDNDFLIIRYTSSEIIETVNRLINVETVFTVTKMDLVPYNARCYYYYYNGGVPQLTTNFIEFPLIIYSKQTDLLDWDTLQKMPIDKRVAYRYEYILLKYKALFHKYTIRNDNYRILAAFDSLVNSREHHRTLSRIPTFQLDGHLGEANDEKSHNDDVNLYFKSLHDTDWTNTQLMTLWFWIRDDNSCPTEVESGLEYNPVTSKFSVKDDYEVALDFEDYNVFPPGNIATHSFDYEAIQASLAVPGKGKQLHLVPVHNAPYHDYFQIEQPINEVLNEVMHLSVNDMTKFYKWLERKSLEVYHNIIIYKDPLFEVTRKRFPNYTSWLAGYTLSYFMNCNNHERLRMFLEEEYRKNKDYEFFGYNARNN